MFSRPFIATSPTKVVAVSTTSQSVTLGNLAIGTTQGAVLVLNNSNQNVAVVLGLGSAPPAVFPTTGTPQDAYVILPNSGMILTTPAGTTHAAVIAAAVAAGNVFITPGFGL